MTHYRKVFEVTGYAFDGAAYCLAHRPDASDTDVAAIFLGTEWDCPGPCCDVCFERIECTHLDCHCQGGEVTMATKIKTLRERILAASEITVFCEPEDEQIRGNFASGDDALDEQTARDIETQLDSGNEWAWCTAIVRLTLRSPRGTLIHKAEGTLGACSYASKADFMAKGGYYDQMVQEALDELVQVIECDSIPLLRSLGLDVKRRGS